MECEVIIGRKKNYFAKFQKAYFSGNIYYKF